MRRVGLELVPELRHELAEVVRLVHVARTPHLLEQLALAHEPVGVAHEDLDQVPLRRRQLDLAAVGIGRTLRREIDAKVGRLDDREHLVSGLGPSQRGAQARQELAHAERLRDVVVGAGVERHDLLGVLVPGGEHDDRDRRPAAQAVHDLDAVDAGKPEIDDRRVVHAGRATRQRGLAGLDEVDLVSARLRGARRAHAAADVRRRRSGCAS